MTRAAVSFSALNRPSAITTTSASEPRFVRGEVATTRTSTSLVGESPVSLRNFCASPSELILSVCSNSSDERGLVRMSASFTMPTVTALAGTSERASSLAMAGRASAATATSATSVRNRGNRFISELLSGEQERREDEATNAECGGGQEWRGSERPHDALRQLLATDEGDDSGQKLGGLREDPVESLD